MFPFICIFASKMKKLVIISLMLCWMLSLSAQFLNSGDTIAIISPSSATDTATINGGIRTLEKWGYPCIVAPHALADYHGFAGTIDERLSDLLWALRTPSIKAIMCSRGGDGAAHLLSRISLDTLQQYPKMIIGFSDVTALLCAQARAGVMGIHGSMCHALKTYEGNDTVSQALRGMLAGHLPTYRIAPHPLNITGKAEGIIVGGNMSVFNDLAGSDFDPLFIDGIVLFIEDTGEGMSKVDRMLHNIEIRGLQKHIRAVIVGQFNKYKHPENGFDDMYALLNEYLQHWYIPVCYNFPVGHAHLKNFPLLTGAKATLEITSDEVVLDYNNSH
ncbi:muramoyltetrapeptide carboxypeptidase [Xylanibacter ruminicola]|uniref:Muramoyltetrapeptide carboxypeptidase n=2 Tax=Xylanibacter ruminicola TaxID=839 RepID=A0A1M7HXT4_XYLRU|nr:muramoyltetrapeptide carboxypeptidase [Xylanibacter ruminicola]SHM32937.1 muramoyltetrapeptide carboxypeptidase [Xylanibacter ruminicola]